MRILLDVFIFVFLLTGCIDGKKELTPISQNVEEPKHPTVNITMTDYCVKDGQRVNFFLHNPYVRVTSQGVLLDNDGDGIHNEEEEALSQIYNISSDHYDTSGDLYFDLIIKLGSYTPDEQTLFPECFSAQDSSNDGLIDCNKVLMGLDPLKFDYDGDGVPDILELYFGTNPLRDDSYLDTVKDNMNNLEKIKRGIPIRESRFLPEIKKYTMEYNLKETKSSIQDGNCFQYQVNNIPINDHIAINKLWLYFIESRKKNGKTENILKRIAVEVSGRSEQVDYKFDYRDYLSDGDD